MSRNELIDELAAKLKDWSAQIDELVTKAAEGGAEMRAETEARITELRAQKELVAAEVERLRSAGGSAWNDVLAGTQAMVKALQDAFDRARSRF